MAHDLHDDGFHEIQLSGKQLVFLFMATTVVSIVIFLCGVLVGRGTPVSAAGEMASADPLGAEASVDQGFGEPPAAPQSNEPTPVKGLSYPERLTASEPGREVVAPAATPAPAPAAEVAKAAPPPTPAPPPPPTPVPAPAVAATPERTTAAEPAAKQAAAKQAAPEPPARPASAAAADGFTVQVTALKSRADAEQIAERLQSRGYRAYVVAPDAGGQVIYKVRVGMNLPRPEAEQVMARLKAEEKFQPWITR